MATVKIYTDGACRGNPGPGGWGAIIYFESDEPREMSGPDPDTTNNRMEMMAVIAALEDLPEEGAPHEVLITSDSQYVIKGMTEWIFGWRRRGWKTASKKPVLNRELWERLSAACSRHRVSWNWVRGHTGHAQNERCDTLANLAIDGLSG